MDYCERYETSRRIHPTTPDPIIDFFIKFIKKGSHGIDVGCGEGRHTCYLNEIGYHVIGIDKCEKAIEKAKDLCSATFFVANSITLPFSKNTFDFVLDFAHLHLLRRKEQKKYIQEVKRVVKPNGKFLLVCFSANSEICKKMCPTRKFNIGRKISYAYFFTKEKLLNLLKEFKIMFIEERHVEGYNKCWVVIAEVQK